MADLNHLNTIAKQYRNITSSAVGRWTRRFRLSISQHHRVPLAAVQQAGCGRT